MAVMPDSLANSLELFLSYPGGHTYSALGRYANSNTTVAITAIPEKKPNLLIGVSELMHNENNPNEVVNAAIEQGIQLWLTAFSTAKSGPDS